MSTRNTRNARQVSRKAIPLEKAHVHDTAKAANTDFLAADITPSDPVVLFRIMVCLDTAAVFSAYVSDGSSEVRLKFGSGLQLKAQSAYLFDMLVNTGDSVNFQADQAVQIEKFLVHEVLWGTQ